MFESRRNLELGHHRHHHRLLETTFHVKIKSLVAACMFFLTAGRLEMLIIDHFIGRETKLPELSKRGKETVTVLEFKRTTHFLGGYFTTYYTPSVLHCFVYYTCSLGSRAVNTIQHGERVVTSTHQLCCTQLKQFTVLYAVLLLVFIRWI